MLLLLLLLLLWLNLEHLCNTHSETDSGVTHITLLFPRFAAGLTEVSDDARLAFFGIV